MVTTIKDVAKKAGVSISTVSKVLKNYKNISKETKEKVLKAVKELKYIPNTMASGLSSKNYNKIALYIYINDKFQAIDEINMQYIQGAFKVTSELNLNVITIFNDSVKNLNDDEFLQYILSEGINGIVVYGLNKEDKLIHQIIKKNIFKMVVIDAPILNDNISNVSVDHKIGQYEVAKTVIEKEYTKKVLYLAGKKNGYVTDERLNGIYSLSLEYGFKLIIEYADFSEKKAYEITIKKASDVDAIVCASDLMAIGAINALIKMNIFRRCSGYDGISLLGYAGKNVMTCKQNFYEISKVAVKEIFNLLNGSKGKKITLPHTITDIKYEDVLF